jgi:hypothetical protein
MKKNNLFIIVLLSFLLVNCVNEKDRDNDFIHENIGIEIEKEILEKECLSFFNSNFSKFYDERFIRVFKVRTLLDKRYYTEKEANNIEVFLAFNQKDLSDNYYFFGIDRTLSDFVFVNHFKDLNMLTLDGHMRYNLNLDSLNNCGCINQPSTVNSVTNTFYENTSFEHDMNKKYIVDSILTKNSDTNYFLNQGDSFHVENNSIFITNKDTIPFFFKNYLLNTIYGNDTTQFKMISQSLNSKILLNIKSETLYFLSKK